MSKCIKQLPIVEYIDKNSNVRVCYYPNHHTDGSRCWCQPEIRIVNDIIITIHNEAN